MNTFGELNLTIAQVPILFLVALQAYHSLAMACTSFICESCMRGYHDYNIKVAIWDASVGEILHCSCEVVLTMIICMLLFIEEIPLATCQGMCREVFFISTARREHYFTPGLTYAAGKTSGQSFQRNIMN